jgi:hypothetical protein
MHVVWCWLHVPYPLRCWLSMLILRRGDFSQVFGGSFRQRRISIMKLEEKNVFFLTQKAPARDTYVPLPSEIILPFECNICHNKYHMLYIT